MFSDNALFQVAGLQVSSCLAFRVSGVGQCVEQADMLDVPYGVIN